MAASTHCLPLLLLALVLVVLHVEAQPATAPFGQLNFTGMLDKGGQYTTFLRLLSLTQIAPLIQNHLNSTTEGLTVLAPTDSAFSKLKPRTINDLSTGQLIQLVLYHVLPKCYTLSSLLTVSNPVRNQASSISGEPYGLNFTESYGNKVKVTSGAVTTQIKKALQQQFPLAVYQLDKVFPNDMFAETYLAPPLSESPAPPVSKTPEGSTNTTQGSVAAEPPTDETHMFPESSPAPAPSEIYDPAPSKTPGGSTNTENATVAAEPHPQPPTDGASGSSKTNVGLLAGLALRLALFFMGE